MAQSTGTKSSGKPAKPAKPYPDFPLFAHGNGQWSKKIRGKHHHFGIWADPDAALRKYVEQRDDLHAGRTPRVQADGLTVAELCNRFLTAKEHLHETGEITNGTFLNYHRTCRILVDAFGKTRLVDDLASDDFEGLRRDLSKTRNVVSLGSAIQRTRIVFKFAFDSGLIQQPIRFGPHFKQPNKRLMRKERNARGPKMFEAREIRALLDMARPQVRTMILLGINCGFGNNDCGRLPIDALDLDGGWVDYPRPKTGIHRRIPLWSETVAAIREAIATRPEAKNDDAQELVFRTRLGLAWAIDKPGDPVGGEMRKLIDRVDNAAAKEASEQGKEPPKKIHRPGLGFYALRHTFQTIGGDARDPDAVSFIMGHSRDDMASVYRERISDERLRAVSAVVRNWLFGEDDAQ